MREDLLGVQVGGLDGLRLHRIRYHDQAVGIGSLRPAGDQSEPLI